MAQIRVENLCKSFDQFTAVHDSNFTIENGTFFALSVLQVAAKQRHFA
jgi:multiple sugar transport system ATP-binding protein